MTALLSYLVMTWSEVYCSWTECESKLLLMGVKCLVHESGSWRHLSTILFLLLYIVNYFPLLLFLYKRNVITKVIKLYTFNGLGMRLSSMSNPSIHFLNLLIFAKVTWTLELIKRLTGENEILPGQIGSPLWTSPCQM